jgi:hypothetical protein
MTEASQRRKRVRAILASAVSMAALAVAAAPAVASDREFTLGLDRLDLSSLDPRTQARLAQWDDPMGRVTAHVQQQQADIMRGGQPGGSGGIAFRVKLQSGFRPRLLVASVDGGVEQYERAMGVIRWPWQETEETVPPLDEQLAILLGRRLEQASFGNQDPPGGP